MQVTIQDLTVRRANSRKVLYSGLSLNIPSEAITGVFGANGLGKSTLLRLLAGVTSGFASNAATAITRSQEDAYTAYVPQNYAASLMPWMSVSENVAIPLRAQKLHFEAAIRKASNALLSQFGVDFCDVPTFRLSGGQQQKVVLLRSISRKPDLLLLDEPFSAIDMYGGAAFRDAFFRHVRKEQITTLFVTHDTTELTRYSDRVILLKSHIGSTCADVFDLRSSSERKYLNELLEGAGADAWKHAHTA